MIDWMIDFGIKGWNHNFSEFNNGENLMNFNINYHFADVRIQQTLWSKLIDAMLETDTINFYLIGISYVEINVSDVI